VESFQVEIEHSFFLRREKFSLRIKLTAGNQPVETAQLGYTLLDAAGNVLGHGPLRPDIRIAATQTETMQVVDPQLSRAKRVEIRKLP